MNKEDYSKYYIQGSDHYLIPKDIFNELFNEMSNWREEAKELKKQLEEYKATNEVLSHELTKDKVLQQDCLTTCCGIPIGDIPKLITQQKEFIEFLEDKIYSIEPKGTGINYNCEYDSEEDCIMAMQEQSRLNTLKEILQKYKEIIGGKE